MTVRGAAAVGRSTPPGSGDVEVSPFSFSRLEAIINGYFPIGPLVLATSAQFGTIGLLGGAGVPIDERFYLGGRNTIRGFVEGTMIPEDTCVTSPNDARPLSAECSDRIAVTRTPEGRLAPPVSLGGNHYVVLKGELRIPLGNSDFSMAAFVDSGNLWVRFPASLTLRTTTGAGLRYATPVGPLALDVGFNPMPRVNTNLETFAQLHFSVGVF